MTQTATPCKELPVPAEPSVITSLASLAAAPEVLLVIVDTQGRILDVRKASPAFLAANLVSTAQSRPDQSRGGDSACSNDAGPYPWRSD
jgi:hypothetical protein